MAKIRRPEASTEIPAAAMADIAFLLLIFFISTTVFSVEKGLTLVLPPKGAVKQQVSRKDVLILRTDAVNLVYADDAPVGDLDGLSHLVAQRLRQNSNLVVSIETHPKARYQTMIKILDEVKEAEARRISIKTAGNPGGGP